MPVKNYVSRNGQIEYEIDEAGEILTYGRDALGNVVAGYDKNTNAVFTIDYKPFGEFAATTGTITGRRFLWVGTWGYRFTPGVPVSHYIRARHLMMRMGMWTTVDPLWPGELAYGYSRSPLSMIDYHGLWCGGTFGDPDVRRHINDALRAIQADPRFNRFLNCLRDPNSTHIPTCNRAVGENPLIGDELEEWFNATGTSQSSGCKPNVTIVQDKGGINSRCKDPTACATTSILSGGNITIHICELTLKAMKCGLLMCVLAHELIHAMGRDHPTDRGKPDEMITPFECINYLNGAGCTGAKATRMGPVPAPRRDRSGPYG